MLAYEWLGIGVLVVLWTNAFLVAAATFADVRDLRARRRELGARLVRGRVKDGAPLAYHEAEQIGRAIEARQRTIAFTERSMTSVVAGGIVDIDGGEVRIAAAPGSVEVWPSAPHAATNVVTFETAYTEAKKFAGFARTIRSEIKTGDEVWIAGDPSAPLVVSAIDPVRWCRRANMLGLVFIGTELALCGAITWLALRPPLFGTWSTLGGALGLAFFLLVQPLGTAVRDAMLPPAKRFIRTAWSDGDAR